MRYPIEDRRGAQTMDRDGNAWERVASWGYGAAVRAFHAAHDANWLPTRRASCLVVSIGALSAGGAGKTPVVRWLAERLVERGRSPAILTRGYRSSGGSTSRVVDARTPDAWRDGDEPVLLARSLPGVPVIVGPDRVRSATLAKTKGADILLLDDGFQHRRLVRDVDVLLWDRTAAEAHGRLLPAGPLREPTRGARRADIVLLVDRGDGVPDPPKHATAPFRFPIALRTHARQAIPDGTPVHVVSGIANPAAFESALVDLGLVVTSATRFPDHHRFTLDDVHRCAQTARRQQAAVLAVTAKDYVRWPKSESAAVPAVFDLDVDVESEDLLLSAILDEGIGIES